MIFPEIFPFSRIQELNEYGVEAYDVFFKLLFSQAVAGAIFIAGQIAPAISPKITPNFAPGGFRSTTPRHAV